MNPTEQNKRVAYLLGIMPRSGTNFLCDLICLHPDCGSTARITEDFLIVNAHHLVQYVDGVHHSWDQLWGEYEEELKKPLFQALGQGLERYLCSLTEKSWIDKHSAEEELRSSVKISPKVCIARTPSVENLDLLSKFTNSKVIVIVRDGRSVVESGMRSFGWLFEDAVQRWARSADMILKAKAENPHILSVRYEDLLSDQEKEMRKIFTFLEVDTTTYNYKAETAVRGSSTHFDDKKGMNWGETKKTKDFNPLKRWEHWERAKHERFNWIAGKQLQAFGYEPVATRGGANWTLYNLAFDAVWPVRHWLRGYARKVLPQNLRAQILWSRGKQYRQFALHNTK